MKKLWFQNKKVWGWIIGVLVVITLIFDVVVFVSARETKNATQSLRNTTSTTMSTTQSGETTDSKNSITLSGKSYKYTQKKTYTVNQTDSSWTDYADLTIKKVTLYRLSASQKIGYSGKSGNTIVVMDLSVAAKKDVDPLLNISSLSVDGQQADAAIVGGSDFSGDINAGVTKDGSLYYIFDSNDDLSNFTKGLRWKGEIFPADSNDTNTKEYDLSFDLS
ncbi:hypothetical protein [uncultured Limosilactobacillus sp.]|uniref:hypothetical protein n=1 Tax=uncultured Limosilactobacillus sp. TaxID=2837629 RepID=UPI0025DBB9ED|nr:hypothetical protein [uncultured Limosilactobacillus sp.]